LIFGGQEQVKEECREAHGTSLIEAVFQDIRYAARVQRKNLSFFIIASLSWLSALVPALPSSA